MAKKKIYNVLTAFVTTIDPPYRTENRFKAYLMLIWKKIKFELTLLGFADNEIISPLDLPHNHKRTWSDYMREDICALMSCSHIYALRNWRQSPGAIIEINLAMSVGINIIFQ